MTQAHFMYLTFQELRRVSERKEIKCPKVKENLKNLCMELALAEILRDNTPIFESGYFKPGMNSLVMEAQKKMLNILRPQMVSLCESFALSDNILCSAIGNYYGDIYE